MRRGLSSLLFITAAALLALAGGGFWMQRIALDPSVSKKLVTVVFEDKTLRAQISTAVAQSAAPKVGKTAEALAAEIEANFPAMLSNPQTRAVLSSVIGQAHARLLGDRSEPVRLSGQQVVVLVRDQRAFDLTAVEIAVAEIGWVSTLRAVLVWLIPIVAALGLIALVLAILSHPGKADVLFGVGAFCLAAGVLIALFGYVVPAFLVPVLTDATWSSLIPAVAKNDAPFVGGVALGLAAIGAALVFGSIGVGRRKTKGWSAPVKPRRYSPDQRQWSR